MFDLKAHIEKQDTLVQRAEELTLSYLAKGAALFSIPTPAVEIRFDLSGQTAGQARWHHRRSTGECYSFVIRINRPLLYQNEQDMLYDTVPHEVAHIIAVCAHGRDARGHGYWWQYTMRAFGLNPSMYHSYSLAHAGGRNHKRYHYECSCSSHLLSKFAHNSCSHGHPRTCKKCNTTLTFTGKAQG